MIRAVLMWIAGRRPIRGIIERRGMRRRQGFARRFIAGLTLDEAMPVLLDLYRQGFTVTLDLLGENVTTKEEARASAQDYIDALDRLWKRNLAPHLSIKLSQLGIDIDPELCRQNVEMILRRAKRYSTYVRIDMESSHYTSRTIQIYYLLRKKGYDNLELTTQACLHRSAGDVSWHIKHRARVRLCKGAYLEPKGIAFTRKKDVDRNYLRLMMRLLRHANHPALATHDEEIINVAKAYARVHDIAQKTFDFEMLYGIRRDLAKRLKDEGYTVRLYVPVGKGWYPYFVRRILERPANAWFVIASLLREKRGS